MALAYGKNPKSYEDPEILAVNRCLARLGNTLRPGVWKVDVFPFLRFESIYYLRNDASHYFADTFQVIWQNCTMAMRKN